MAPLPYTEEKLPENGVPFNTVLFHSGSHSQVFELRQFKQVDFLMVLDQTFQQAGCVSLVPSDYALYIGLMTNTVLEFQGTPTIVTSFNLKVS